MAGRTIWIMAAALLAAGCDETPRDQIRVVGSSTVYPFTTAVAEQFARKDPSAKAPIVESTGTGAGLKLFCAGVGSRHPDIANASRRIKRSELEDCAAHGVGRIVEVNIGIDGIALGESVTGPRMALTEAEVYRALAATPFGRPQRARLWSEVNPALPAIPILVYGPPPTSGTRDAFAELILARGCDTDPAMKALKKTDEDRHKTVCTRVREDGAFVEAGENDNLIVQKLATNDRAIGVFGYSFLAENAARVRGIPLDGVAPSDATIADNSYPARPLYVYVKAAHLAAVPTIRPFLREYAASWNPGGPLARRGLIPLPAAARARNRTIAERLTPLDPRAVS